MKVFLSSTAKDLAPYRLKAAAAIQKLEHECVRMEDFGARDDAPLHFCQQRVQECDVFVGIIGLTYGSHPPENETSFTIFEYEAAVTRNIPCFMFLLWDDGASVEGQSERETVLQRDFRERLKKERICAMFETPSELALELTAALGRWTAKQGAVVGEPGSRRNGRAVQRSWLVSKMCNRQKAEQQFSMFFASYAARDARQPQIYLLRGVESDCPESLVQRFVHTTLRDFAREKWGTECGIVDYKDIEWPSDCSRESLGFNLLREFHPHPDAAMEDAALAATFAKRCASLRMPAIALQHEIRVRDRVEVLSALIHWYLAFWDYIAEIPDCPRIYIFLTLLLPKETPRPWWGILRRKGEIGELLQRSLLGVLNERQAALTPETRSNAAPCLLIDPLDQVEPDDVMSWFRRHKIHDDISLRQRICEEIFGGRPKRCMAEIEGKLREVCERYEQTV